MRITDESLSQAMSIGSGPRKIGFCKWQAWLRQLEAFKFNKISDVKFRWVWVKPHQNLILLKVLGWSWWSFSDVLVKFRWSFSETSPKLHQNFTVTSPNRHEYIYIYICVGLFVPFLEGREQPWVRELSLLEASDSWGTTGSEDQTSLQTLSTCHSLALNSWSAHKWPWATSPCPCKFASSATLQ